MKTIFFTPGPSQLYPTVEKHIRVALKKSVPSMNHRGKDFKALYEELEVRLKTLLFIPNDYSIFFLSSANEAWERIIENCVAKTSFHFVNGAFSNRFYKIACELKKDPVKVEKAWGEEFDYSVKIPKKTELIACTQNETSSGTRIDESIIHKTKKRYPNQLIAVDIVSSAPCTTLDFSLTDCVFFSVQKGFGLPPGLCILVVSPAAMEKSIFLQKKNYDIGSYHNFQTLASYKQKNQTPETPNTLALYLLTQVLSDMQKKCLKKIQEETTQKAKLLYDFFDQHPMYQPFVTSKSIRSETVAVINTPNGSKTLINTLKKSNYIIGAGYGERKEEQVRIANFPAHTLTDIKQLIRIIKKES